MIIPLEGLSIRENTDYKNKHCFELFDPNNHKIKSCKLGPQGPIEGEKMREIGVKNKVNMIDFCCKLNVRMIMKAG